MEASDDDFSDLELDEDDADLDQPPPNSPFTICSFTTFQCATSTLICHAKAHQSSPPSSPFDSPSQRAMLTRTLKPVEVKSFNSPVGLTTAIPESPREVFEMFFTDDLMKLMVTENNRYAEDIMGSEKFAKWTEITVEEMKTFLEFSFLIVINQCLAIKDY